MKWHVNKVVYLDSSDFKIPFRADIFKISENVTIEFTLNSKGQIQKIDNLSSVQETYQHRLDSIFSNLAKQHGVDATKSEGAGMFYEMIRSKPDQNIFFSHLLAFFKLYGTKMSMNTNFYNNESWVGTKDTYKINVDKLDKQFLTLKSELVDGGTALKYGRTIKRLYVFDVSDFWLTYFSSDMNNKDNGESVTINEYKL
jgi:hypothetical protein